GFCGLVRSFWPGRSGTGWLQLFDCALHDASCDLAAASLFHGALPSQLHLLRREVDWRSNLRLPFGLALRANCSQLGKELGRSDQLIGVAAAILRQTRSKPKAL